MDFRLTGLRLENFRCFESATIELDETLVVLIADNGHGKTATLDALATGLGQLLGPAQLPPRRSPADRVQLRPSDATTHNALPPYREGAFPVSQTVSAMIDGERSAWSGTLASADADPVWEMPPAARAVASPATRKRGAEVNLPVFAYYGTNRTGASVLQRDPPTLGRPDRAYGYRNSLRAGEALEELAPWLAQGEWERSGRGESIWDVTLDAMYEASTQVLASHGVSRVSYSMEDRDLVLDFGLLRTDPESGLVAPVEPGSTIVPMHLVADGYRSVLGMVADLAFRCGVLNHHLGAEAPQLTSGVVLIDEIDMHLHPSWQTHVLRDLAQAFPRVQFIVTTHSPFVLSSVDSDAVRRITSTSGRSAFEVPDRSTEGVRIEILTEALLDAPVRASTEYVELLEELADALRRRDLETAQEVADRISAGGATDDPDALRLMAELRWRLERESS